MMYVKDSTGFCLGRRSYEYEEIKKKDKNCSFFANYMNY